jgi:transposase
MAKALISDELWQVIEPHIPIKPRKKCHPGRKPLPPRNSLSGILFVLMSGIPWEMLPQEMGCGSGMTCWRRLRDWQAAGVWQKIHEILLAKLRNADQIDFGRCAVDSATIRAVGGAKEPVLAL